MVITQYIALTCVSVVILVAALHKVQDPRLFRQQIIDYQLVNESFANLLGRLLLWSEIIIVSLIWLPTTRALGAIALAGLLLCYTSAIAINLLRGRTQIDCGCFGPGIRQSLSIWLVLRNVILIAAAIYIAIVAASPAAPFTWSWYSGGIIVLASSAFLLLYVIGNLLIANRDSFRQVFG